MEILLTNDDGIYAPGIQLLAKELRKKHNLTIVSPDRERSATGHAITLNKPLRAKKVKFDDLKDVSCYKISGTPADCVKLAVKCLLECSPDLIISGINNGSNIGYDVVYSGTVSAAVEGWMMGIKSIAVSLSENNYREKQYYSTAVDFIKKFIKSAYIKNRKREIFNINIPDITRSEIEGTVITFLTKCLYDDYYEIRKDPAGNNYYWLTGEIKGKAEDNSDLWALKNNKISITPLEISLSSRKKVNELKDFNLNW